MRFHVFRWLLVFIGNTLITNFIHGIYQEPLHPALGSHSGLGATLGVLALAAIIPNVRGKNPTTTILPECPMRYRLYSTRCGKFCYRIENQNCRNFIDAQASCAVDGGDLLSVDTCHYDFFVALASRSQGGCDENFWIGANRTQPGAGFVTVKGDILSERSVLWADGEPSRSVCVEMDRGVNYRLDAVGCSRDNGYICQIFIKL